jgi:PAS domain S-box-containing protein
VVLRRRFAILAGAIGSSGAGTATAQGLVTDTLASGYAGWAAAAILTVAIVVVTWRWRTAARRAAQPAQQDAEALYIKALDSSGLAIQIANAAGRRVFVNQAYVELIGYKSAEALLNAPPAAFIAPHESERVAGYRNAMMAGRPFPSTYDMDAIRKDGTPLRVRVYLTSVMWKGEKAVQRIFVDITKVQATEAALRASEERLRNAQRIARVGDWQRNYKTGESVWSEETYRIFGIEPTQAPGWELFLSLVHPDDVETLMAAIGRAVEKGEPHALDHRIIRPDGEQRIVHEMGECAFDEDGEPLTFSGTAQEVTELRLAEQAQARSEARLRNVIEAGGVGIVLSDGHGRCTLVNTEFTRLVDAGGADCSARPISGFIHEMDRPAFEAAFRALDINANPRMEMEARLESGDDAATWASINVTATREPGSSETHYIAIILDITDRKAAEAALARNSETLDLARDMAIATNLAPGFAQAVRDCIDRICAYTSWSIGHAYVRDPADQRRFIPMGRPWLDNDDRLGEFASLTAGVRYQEGDGFVGRTVAARAVAWQNGFPQDRENPGPRGMAFARMGIHLGVGVPVMVGDRIVAVLEFFATEQRPRDEALCEILLQLGTLLGRVYERENAAKALSDRENQLSQIIDNVPYRIFVKDREGRFLLVNSAVESFFNSSKDQIIGYTLHDFYPDSAHIQGFAEAEREVIEKGVTHHVPEERIVGPDGKVRLARTIKTRYTTKEGERAVLGMSIDITEEKAHQ